MNRTVELRQQLIWVGAVILLLGSVGCARSAAPRSGAAAARRVDPKAFYATYRFDRSADVLSFGVQPLWIPTCLIWEVMGRDPRLREDLRRTHCRLDAFPFFKGRDLNEYLVSGKLQGGMGDDLPALKAATEAEVRIVSLIQQGPCAIIARQRMPVSRLRGLRIGYAPGSNAHYTVLHRLKEHGLGPKDVRFVAMEMIDMADALAAGRVDAFSAWEPTPTLALLDHPSFEVLDRAEARGFLYFTRSFFERRPEVVRALVASQIRALHWLGKSEKNTYIASRWARDRAVQFGTEELALTVYDFVRLAQRDILRFPNASRLPPELLSPEGALYRQFALSRELGLIAARSDWDRVRASFAIDVVPELLASPTRYALDDLRIAARPE